MAGIIPVAPQTAAKFDNQGWAQPYPGNTIVARLGSDDPSHRHLVDLVHALKAAPGAEAHCFLPDTSYHMTLFRGANDRLRIPGDWPENVPLDTPLPAVEALFLERLQQVSLPGLFRMRPVGLSINPTGEIQLALEGWDVNEKEKLASSRARLMSAMRHRRRGDENYHFHITFTYRCRPTDNVRQDALESRLESLFHEFVLNTPILNLRDPAFCSFSSMLQFEPVRWLASSNAL